MYTGTVDVISIEKQDLHGIFVWNPPVQKIFGQNKFNEMERSMMKKKRVLAALLSILMVFPAAGVSMATEASVPLSKASQKALGDADGFEKTKEYKIKLDANGGFFPDENYEELDFETKAIQEDEILEQPEKATPSEANQNQELEEASASNAKYEDFGSDRDNIIKSSASDKKTVLEFEASSWYEVEEILDGIYCDSGAGSYLNFGWTTKKDDIMTNVYNRALFGGIGVGESNNSELDRDLILYAYWMSEAVVQNSGKERDNLIQVGYKGHFGSNTVETSDPILSKEEFIEELKNSGKSYSTENLDYNSAFQLKLIGSNQEKKGILLCDL